MLDSSRKRQGQDRAVYPSLYINRPDRQSMVSHLVPKNIYTYIHIYIYICIHLHGPLNQDCGLLRRFKLTCRLRVDISTNAQLLPEAFISVHGIDTVANEVQTFR